MHLHSRSSPWVALALPLTLPLALAPAACGEGEPALDARPSAALGDRVVTLIEDHDDHAIERAVQVDAHGEYVEASALAPAPPAARPARLERLLAVRVRWLGVEPFCGPKAVEEALFDGGPGSVATWMREGSFGQARLEGEVVGPIEIERGDTCAPGVWATRVDEALVAQGIDPTAASRRMYFLPGAPCAWSGLAELGGQRAWINGGACGHRPTIAHELGHTLGLHHASTPQAEYGDLSDPMGGPGAGLVGLNAPHAADLGWLEAAPLGTGGTFELSATAEPAGLRALIGGSGGDPWVVSLRRRVGHDGALDPAYADRVSVHRARPHAAQQTQLVGLLDAGAAWTAADGTLEVSVLSLSEGRATVTVRAPCIIRPLQLTLGDRLDVAPGEAATVEATLRRDDSGDCGEAAIALDDGGSVAGLSLAFSPARVALPVGGAARVTATLRAALDAAPGEQALVARLTRRRGERQGVWVAAFVDVAPPEAPIALTASLPNPHEAAVSLAIAMGGDDSGRVAVEIERDGAVALAAREVDPDRTALWTDKPVPPGRHVYRARAVDRAGHASPWTSPATVVVRVR